MCDQNDDKCRGCNDDTVCKICGRFPCECIGRPGCISDDDWSELMNGPNLLDDNAGY